MRELTAAAGFRPVALPSSTVRSGVPKKVPKSIVPMLLRTRPVANGPCFRIHAVAIGKKADSSALPEKESLTSGSCRSGLLIVNVPKRIFRRAVERNAIRRVAREAWRASGLQTAPIDLLVRVHGRPHADPASATPVRGLPSLKRMMRQELDPLFARARSGLHKRGTL